MPKWVYSLRSFETDEHLGVLENATSKTLSPSLNAPGAAGFSLPIDDDMAYLVDNHSTYLVVERWAERVWTGIVSDVDDTVPEDKTVVSCLGWWDIVESRFTAEKIVFTSDDLGHMSCMLLAHTETFDGTMGFAVNPTFHAGIVLPRRTIEKDTNIAEEIKKYTEVENGIDFYFNEALEQFEFVNRLGIDRPDAQFGYLVGPDNLARLKRSRQGSRKANKVVVRGKSGSAMAKDQASIDASGTYMDVISLGDVPGSEAGTTMLGYAGAEVAIRKDPITTYEFGVKGADPDIVIPEAYADFKIGDTCRLSAERGRLYLDNQGVRMYSFSLAVDDDGDAETLTSISVQP